MTDKPKITDYLDMSWAELKVKLCAEIQGVLHPGPWMHEFRDDVDLLPEHRCLRCKDNVNPNYSDCPVPPPITAEPEVVAERLLARFRAPGLVGLQMIHAVGTMYELCNPDDHLPCGERDVVDDYWWYILFAIPTQRILTCLLALGAIEE